MDPQTVKMYKRRMAVAYDEIESSLSWDEAKKQGLTPHPISLSQSDPHFFETSNSNSSTSIQPRRESFDRFF